MNWYKRSSDFTGYYDIGHHKSPYYLWVFINGILEDFYSETGEDDHTKIWPHMQSSHYRGRFDAKTKKVSVVNPFAGRNIPNHLIKKLYDKFGDDIKIVEFY